jgi:ADP-ribose pyrophosphatase YjhB (NUDIX family)
LRPGCWGLFGVHLDPGETPEEALRRELLEEISWQPQVVGLVIVHRIQRRTAHVFRAELSVPLQDLQLLMGEDLVLVGAGEILAGSIWSSRMAVHRPWVDGLLEMMEKLVGGLS